MSTEELHQGILTRQVLKGKRKVRIAFLPDNPELKPHVTIRTNDIGEKITWKALLEKKSPNPENIDNIDIDTGVTFLRFNNDLTSGTVTFLPASSKQLIIVNQFLKTEDETGIPDASPEEFANCVQDRKNTEGDNFNLAQAIAVCLVQLP